MRSTSDAASRNRVAASESMALWREYRASGDIRVRNRLVMTFAPLVKYIVFRKVRELPARCDVEDFISCGLEALIASLDRYDPDRGATLEQFVWTRIHGAVLDELRRLDWAPRSLRRWEREAARARRAFTLEEGRPPTPDELAAALGMTRLELSRRQDDLAMCDVGSLNAPVLSEDGDVERVDTLQGHDDGTDPELVAWDREAKRRFRRAFDTLPPREREIAVLLYVKNLTLREVGEVMGVSESRVCQIHAGLKRTLRDRLESEASLFTAVG